MREERLELLPFEFDADTYRNLAIGEFRHNVWWALPVSALATAAILAVVTVQAHRFGLAPALKAWLPLLIMMPLWGAFLLWYAPRSFTKDPANRFRAGRYSVVLDKDQLQVEIDTGRVQHTIPLTHLTRFAERSSYYALYDSPVTVILVPNSAFPNHEVQAEFRRRLREARELSA